MTDRSADSAVVRAVVVTGVEERRLQPPGGEYDFIELRGVIRIHRWRRHEPLSAIYRLSDFRQIAMLGERASVHEVRCIRTLFNFERAVVLPLVGIADLLVERSELDQCLLPRRLVHPVSLSNAVADYGPKILDHLRRLGLCFGRECDLYVLATKRFAEHSISRLETTLPPRLHRSRASQH